MSKKQREKKKIIKSKKENNFLTSKLLKVKCSLKKIKPLVDIIKKKNIYNAKNILLLQNKKRSKTLFKLLESACCNAEKKGVNREKLYIKEFYANSAGIKYKIIKRSQGRFNRIRIRFSNLFLKLEVNN